MINEKKEMVKCFRCGCFSEQLIASTNDESDKGDKQSQKCPFCNYEASNISVYEVTPIYYDEDDTNIFKAYEGGFFSDSYHFYINKINDQYQFRFEHLKPGDIPKNNTKNPKLSIIYQDENYYNNFIKELLNIVENWRVSYANKILDGNQWSIELIELKKEYYGSNDYPSNYREYKALLKKYFNV